MKILKYALLCSALLFFAVAVILFPERYIPCCFGGFALWAECVLPSLFPFMIITLIFIKTGVAEKASLPLKRVTSLFNLPPAAAACFIMSVMSGYPAGSRILTEFYDNGAFTKNDVKKLACLCSTSGPLFIVGSVGFKMFANKLIGLQILIAHVISVTVTALLLALRGGKRTNAVYRRAPVSGNLLYETFYSAVISVAVAGGFIAFFYVFAQFCADFNLLFPLAKFLSLFISEPAASAVCSGILEATTGCAALAAANDRLSPPLAGFIITFGGVSILAQQLGYLTRAGVKPLRFATVKAAQGALCFLLLLPLSICA